MVNFSNKMNTTVPAFLAKLWALVDDSNTNDLIKWSETGLSFVVFYPIRFSKEILPKYFKHNNMTSFIRQLNMYGFRKIANIEQGNLSRENENLEFFHPLFKRGNIHLLALIKRKPTFKPEDMRIGNNLSGDISKIQNSQLELEAKIDDIKRENIALWDELLYMRQKYNKQQIIVKKLIQFLMAMMAPNFKLRKPFINNGLFNQEKLNLMAIDQPKKFSIDQKNCKKIDEGVLTDMGVPSAGLLKDVELELGESSSASSNPLISPSITLLNSPGELNATNIIKDSELFNIPPHIIQRGISTESQIQEDINVNEESPLMEVVIDNETLLNTDESDEIDLDQILLNTTRLSPKNSTYKSSALNSPLDNLTFRALQDEYRNNKPYSHRFNFGDNQIVPNALLDHVNYSDPINPSLKSSVMRGDNGFNGAINNSDHQKVETLLANILGDEELTNHMSANSQFPSTSSAIQSPSLSASPSLNISRPITLNNNNNNKCHGTGNPLDLSFDDMYEQMMYDMMIDDENGGSLLCERQNSLDVLSKPNITRDYFSNYNEKPPFLDVKDLLTQTNFSFDSKLLMELLGTNSDSNNILGRNNDLLKIDSGTTHYEKEGEVEDVTSPTQN